MTGCWADNIDDITLGVNKCGCNSAYTRFVSYNSGIVYIIMFILTCLFCFMFI